MMTGTVYIDLSCHILYATTVTYYCLYVCLCLSHHICQLIPIYYSILLNAPPYIIILLIKILLLCMLSRLNNSCSSSAPSSPDYGRSGTYSMGLGAQCGSSPDLNKTSSWKGLDMDTLQKSPSQEYTSSPTTITSTSVTLSCYLIVINYYSCSCC